MSISKRGLKHDTPGPLKFRNDYETPTSPRQRRHLKEVTRDFLPETRFKGGPSDVTSPKGGFT